MSYIFEGILHSIVCHQDKLSSSTCSTRTSLKTKQINHDLLVTYRYQGREDKLIFSLQMEDISRQLSISASKALLIRYDDRVGYRASTLFENGMLTYSFNLSNEIWVMVDQSYEPIQGKQFSLTEVENDNENEYVTLHNAIQLGLDVFGLGDWQELHSFITSKAWEI